MSRILFSEFYKIMMNEDTSVSFMEKDRALWIRPWLQKAFLKIIVDCVKACHYFVSLLMWS